MPDDTPQSSNTNRLCRRLTTVTALVTGVLVLLVVLAGPLSKSGVLHYGTALTILMVGAFASLITGLLATLALVCSFRSGEGRSRALSAGSLVASIAVATTLWIMATNAQRVPPIHDITTDIVDPPLFEAVLAVRAPDDNSADYAGINEVGRFQESAYPDIETVYLMEPVSSVFERAEAAARDMGWEIVAADEERGRIEATATTFWFGFKDDVVIRVEAAPGGATALDIRSASRVGKSDIGANAARIRAFLERMNDLS